MGSPLGQVTHKTGVVAAGCHDRDKAAPAVVRAPLGRRQGAFGSLDAEVSLWMREGCTGDALGVSFTGSRVRVLPWQYHGVPLARKFYLERR